MAGNVSEWVLDVYRPLTSEDVDEFRPFRGNVFKTKVLNASGSIDEKYDATIYDIYGLEQYLINLEPKRQAKLTENTVILPRIYLIPLKRNYLIQLTNTLRMLKTF